MSTNIIDVSQFTDPVVAPADGDTRNAASVNVAFQALADRTRLLLDATIVRLVWSGDFSVADGGTLTSFSISVGAIGQLLAADSSADYHVANATAGTVTQAHILGGGGTLGAVAQWWYVYAYVTTLGAVSYEVTTTAPESSRRCKLADATRAYLGCFRTLASGAPLPAQKANGRYLYRASALGSNELRVVNVSTATGATAQSLATLVPPHGRIARLLLSVSGDVNQAALSIFYPGDTAAESASCYAASGGASNQIHVDVPTDASQVVDYSLTGTGSPSGVVRVLGFYE